MFTKRSLLPHERRASRLQEPVRCLGFALGEHPARALAECLLLPVGKDTFLRSVRRSVAEAVGGRPRVLVAGRDRLCKADAILVARIKSALLGLVAASRPAEQFTAWCGVSGEALEAWLDEAEEGPLGAFARGLRQDPAAVAAVLREPWSNGRTEGRINRLKTLKHQTQGGANIDLSRGAARGSGMMVGNAKLHQKLIQSSYWMPIDNP